MSCAVNNNAFEVIITPSRKRKRDSGHNDNFQSTSTNQAPSVFTNAAFSSTPKKEIKDFIAKCKRSSYTKETKIGKENQKKFPPDSGLEVKSISEIANEKANTESGNPFEVIRKPPKKKKKPNVQDACFINPGLNLELPEKQFNPFEVKRNVCSLVKSEEAQCFVNPALNIRSQDTTATKNPFEIQRQPTDEIPKTIDGIENFGLDLTSAPLKIGVPFKPSVGYRIDFSNLTPSKLLADKLVLSPINKTPRVLSDISEEEATMDIGRELDRYQLELENSINEAKQKKTKSECVSFSNRLQDIAESPQEVEIEEEPRTPEIVAAKPPTEDTKNIDLQLLDEVDTPPVKQVTTLIESSHMTTIHVHKEKILTVKEKHNESYTDDEGVDYDDDDEDEELDFKAPTPFVRAYRKPVLSTYQNIEATQDDNKPVSEIGVETKSKVKDIIRKSFRKLIHSEKEASDLKPDKKLPSAGSHLTGHNIMEAIRHSLRRRPQKPSVAVEVPKQCNISIIDTSERKMKLKSNVIQTDFIKIEELNAERKSTLRSSIRKSTRDVKNQIMKTVFHKNKEEYDLAE